MFDKEGNYVEWLSAMAEAYEERADCFEDQYTRYSVIEHRTGNMSIKVTCIFNITVLLHTILILMFNVAGLWQANHR